LGGPRVDLKNIGGGPGGKFKPMSCKGEGNITGEREWGWCSVETKTEKATSAKNVIEEELYFGSHRKEICAATGNGNQGKKAAWERLTQKRYHKK